MSGKKKIMEEEMYICVVRKLTGTNKISSSWLGWADAPIAVKCHILAPELAKLEKTSDVNGW